jgi:2-C-methyl-D-erythritol 4-phosphate cytidylyltransferase
MHKKIAALLLLGGVSQRCSGPLPKQFLTLGEKKVYEHALETLQLFPFDEIVLVCHEDYISMVQKHGLKVVVGGKTRQESVFNGLKALQSVDYCLIHEGARPFVSHRIIKEHFEQKEQFGALATCIKVDDTVCIQKEGRVIEIPDRSIFERMQMPQTFHFELIFDAHKRALEKKIFNATEDCQLILPHPIKIIEGEAINFKITTSFDLKMANYFAAAKILQ